MKKIKYCVLLLSLASCTSRNPDNSASSTPIDSTNVKGTAPATYGANNPARDQDSNRGQNVGDTGTKANNVHNAGTYNHDRPNQDSFKPAAHKSGTR